MDRSGWQKGWWWKKMIDASTSKTWATGSALIWNTGEAGVRLGCGGGQKIMGSDEDVLKGHQRGIFTRRRTWRRARLGDMDLWRGTIPAPPPPPPPRPDLQDLKHTAPSSPRDPVASLVPPLSPGFSKAPDHRFVILFYSWPVQSSFYNSLQIAGI